MPLKRIVARGQAALRIAQGRRLVVVDRYAFALTTLGITEPALLDLERLNRWNTPPAYRMRAARTLALWYADQARPEALQRALGLLRFMSRHTRRDPLAREIAIMQAECMQRLGQAKEAEARLRKHLSRQPHVDLYMAMASVAHDPRNRVSWLNAGLQHCGLAPVDLRSDAAGPPSHRLAAGPSPPLSGALLHRRPRVSVIVATCNAAATIRSTLRSLSAQTWEALEIVVSDDGSRDGTREVVETCIRADPRIRLVTSRRPDGPYAARNRALDHCTGEFVTCSDADVWSHPQRIEIQASHLMGNPDAVGNVPEQARLLDDLSFSRWPAFGRYSQHSLASFMFRRDPVREELGCWDTVRFGADDELVLRVRARWGEAAAPRLHTGPVQFVRITEPWPPPEDPFADRGVPYGARHAYLEAARAFHAEGDVQRFRYRFPARKRPFPVPGCMIRPAPAGTGRQPRHFDVVLASEFRFPGGTSTSNAQEIRAQRAAGLKTGLVQLSRYRQVNRDMNPAIRGLIDGDRVQEIVYGERVSCDLLIVKHPTVLQHAQRFVPAVETRHGLVVVNQTPRPSYGKGAAAEYDLTRCDEHFRSFFQCGAHWVAVGPSVREQLLRHHAEALRSLRLADGYWHELIDIGDWRRTDHRVNTRNPRIGRHTRDHPTKWPGNKKDLLRVYPDKGPYQVWILGGAKHARAVLGTTPRNWRVDDFGSVEPVSYLRELDVFVYYPREDLVEAFGRSILEAMATGVPVVLPPRFRATFGEAAIYAEPRQALACVDRLIGDPAFYERQVRAAWTAISERFSAQHHLDRIRPFLRRATPR